MNASLHAHRTFMARRQAMHVLLFDGLPLPLLLIVVPLTWPRLAPTFYDFTAALALWLVSCLGITVGYHRLFTHRAFRCGRGVKVALGLAGSLAAAGPVIAWVATHRKHHQTSDAEGDPHSPHLAGAGWLGKARGFLHAQFGWLVGHDLPSPATYARDLLADPTVVWVNGRYFAAALAGIVAPALLVQLWSPGWRSFFSALVWAGFVRVLVVHQIISSVNSVCHLFGTRPYDTKEHSRNNALLALPTVGEAWHNNHHRHPASAYIGLRWWQLDPGGWLVAALHRAGLIWAVNDARAKPDATAEPAA
jgi:stearoyl-CoA desaturase (delta-9 desaturase)